MGYVDTVTGKTLTKSKNTHTDRWRWNISKTLFRWIDKELADELVKRGALSNGKSLKSSKQDTDEVDGKCNEFCRVPIFSGGCLDNVDCQVGILKLRRDICDQLAYVALNVRSGFLLNPTVSIDGSNAKILFATIVQDAAIDGK